eukprot:CAMPEP_0175134400 /NCGR_PEP_ID=MMETSP0087-20121206/8157_1 /TAXON_ID=136419 /ORGANISM="Unknown Unknown, Strain D1" /LENGTH=377 /DNA_ID=CAMNT_0016416957 /DNA_START=143 /DNA_END=1272 /DNA_ORIENTATION=+
MTVSRLSRSSSQAVSRSSSAGASAAYPHARSYASADHFDSLIANETFYIHELATFLELLAPHVGTFIQRSFHSGCSGLLDFHRFWLTVLTRTKSQFVLCESKTAFHKLLAEAFTKYSDFFRIYATFVKQVHLFYDSIQKSNTLLLFLMSDLVTNIRIPVESDPRDSKLSALGAEEGSSSSGDSQHEGEEEHYLEVLVLLAKIVHRIDYYRNFLRKITVSVEEEILEGKTPDEHTPSTPPIPLPPAAAAAAAAGGACTGAAGSSKASSSSSRSLLLGSLTSLCRPSVAPSATTSLTLNRSLAACCSISFLPYSVSPPPAPPGVSSLSLSKKPASAVLASGTNPSSPSSSPLLAEFCLANAASAAAAVAAAAAAAAAAA